MQAILWKLHTGAPWRDIPEDLYPWQTAFNRWVSKGLWESFFKLRGILDKEWVFIEGNYIRAHQYASGARHGEDRAIVKSRDGATTKIHIVVDASAHPIDFEITGSEVHGIQVPSHSIELVDKVDYLIADKGYDSEHIREVTRSRKMIQIIPTKSNSKIANMEFDYHLYRLRDLVENAFARLKQFRVFLLVLRS